MHFAKIQLVVIFNEMGHYADALHLLNEVLNYDANDVIGLFEWAKIDEYLKEKQAAQDNWALFLELSKDYTVPAPYPPQNFSKHRAFAEERLKALERGEPFLTPPSPQNRLNWGEIPDK